MTDVAFKDLTPAQKKARVEAELASRVLSRRSLLQFTKRMNPAYVAGWVHRDICRRLEKFSDDVVAKRSPRLMILMPPRHGKSELASRNFPPWHLGRNPAHEVIACSYNLSLAMTFSRKAQAVIEDPLYKTVFDTKLDPNHKSIEEWGLLNASGGFVAAGVGGGITGKGAHVLSIDDPLKSAEDADSPDIREKLWDWYGSTAYTRLAPGGGVLVIQTCWHDDDLAGRLQAAMKDPEADQFEIVKYPAIAEAHEFLDQTSGAIVRMANPAIEMLGLDASTFTPLRAKGEPLHPERYDLKKLTQIRKTLPARFWSALYQQNPVPEDGRYFLAEQFRRAPLPKKSECNISVAFDFAISTKTQNDWTVGSVGLTDYDDMLHVAEMVRFKSADAFHIADAILNLVSRWYTPALVLGVEDGQIWRSIEAVVRKRMKERRQFFVIKVLKPLTDKRARASVLQARMEQGQVSFNIVGDWFDAMKAELLRFDNGVNDDQVDSLGWMARVAQDKPPPRRPKTAQMKSWKDQLLTTPSNVGHMAA